MTITFWFDWRSQCSLPYSWPWLIFVPCGQIVLFCIHAVIWEQKQQWSKYPVQMIPITGFAFQTSWFLSSALSPSLTAFSVIWRRGIDTSCHYSPSKGVAALTTSFCLLAYSPDNLCQCIWTNGAVIHQCFYLQQKYVWILTNSLLFS